MTCLVYGPRGFEDNVKTNGAQSWFAKIQDVGYGGGLDLQRVD